MYYASFFPPPMRPLDARQLDGMAALVGRGERGEIPLDLSLKRGEAEAAEELLLLEHRKLAAAYAAGRPLLDPATYLRLQQYQQRVAADAFLQQAAAQHHALAAAARLGCLDQHVAGVYPPARTPFLEPALAVGMRGPGAPALAPGDLARSFYPPTAATAFPTGLPPGYSSMFADLLPKPEHWLPEENGLVSSKSSYLSTRSPVNGEKSYEAARYAAEQLAQAKYATTTSSSSVSSHSRDHKRSSSSRHSESSSSSRHSESSSRHPSASTAHSDAPSVMTSPSLNLLGPRPSLGGGLSSAFGETLKRDEYLPSHLPFCPPWGLPPLIPPVTTGTTVSSASVSTPIITPSPQRKKEPKTEHESPRKGHHSSSNHSNRHPVPPSKRPASPSKRPASPAADENGDIIVIDEELRSSSSSTLKTSSAGGGRPPPPPEPQRARMPRLEAMQPPDEAKTSHVDIKRQTKSPLSPPPLIAAVPPATSPKTGEAASIAAILKQSPPHKPSRSKSNHDEKPTLNFYHAKVGVTTTAPSTLPTSTTTTDASYLHQHRHYLTHHQLHHHPMVQPIVNSELPSVESESNKASGDWGRKPLAAGRPTEERNTKTAADKTPVPASNVETQRKEERKATTVRIQKENGGVRYSIHPKKRKAADDSASSSGGSLRSSPSDLARSTGSRPVTKKVKRHLRHQFLARMPSRCVVDSELQSLKPEFRQRRLLYQAVRRRRLRSGLDMIHRYKKVKSGRYKVVRRAPRKPFKEVNCGTPPDLKKFLVNKALGETVLHRAARLGYSDLVLYCLQSGEGGDVDARDNAGYTPLHESCSRGHLTIARALLEYGADPNASSAGGVRPLHEAVENNHVEVVRLLLSYGADASISTYAGLTPLKLARSAVMLELLRGFLSDIAGESIDGKPVLPWHFSGTASLMDPCATGYDVLAGAPDEDDGGDFLFEVSDAPHLPTFRLPLGLSTQTTSNCMRLSDVLQRVRMTADEFRQRYPEVEIFTFSSHEVEARVSPWSFDMSPGSGVCSGGLVDIVRLDETLRQVLGIETVALR